MTTEIMKHFLEKDKWPRDEYEMLTRPTSGTIWGVSHRYNDAIDSCARTVNTLEELSDKTKKELERKDDIMIYHVKFDGSDKLYAYYSKVPLQVGAIYSIEADGITTYKNNVTVIKANYEKPYGVSLRTITKATIVTGTKRPDDRIKQVIFNKEKRTTVVLWYDGQKTIIKQQDGDVWDEEKALALCYMKRVLGNRGSFNETLKKYCNLPVKEV